MSSKGSNAFLLAWDRLIANESNIEIKKLMRRKMKANISPKKFETTLKQWRSARTQQAKKILKRQLRAL